jgi:hypothetical protein
VLTQRTGLVQRHRIDGGIDIASVTALNPARQRPAHRTASEPASGDSNQLNKEFRMKRLSIAVFCFFVLISSCRNESAHSALESITKKDQLTGKWLGTIGIGLGSPGWEYVKMLRDVLHKTFLTPQGGSYKNAFDINDGEGRAPSKQQIVEEFSKLASEISEFRKQNPQAPTMVVLGITGHGISRKTAESFIKNNYEFSVTKGTSKIDPPETFSGQELAELLKSLSVAGADEVVVFIQSCHSGALNTDLDALGMSKFIESLTSDGRSGRTFTVITPTSTYYMSPGQIWEEMLAKALETQGEGDIITYKTIKDRLVKEACSSPFYRPAEAKEGLSSMEQELVISVELKEFERQSQQQQQQQAQPQQPEVAADDSQNMTMSDSESVSYLGANAGIDPQFFEVIDENLPILLTPTGLEKWNNATLTLPEPAPAKTKVELSAETTALCEQRKQVMIPLIQQRIQELLQQAPNVAP